MKNDEFATPEILDVTEVEKARLHEEGETNRKRISEQEETVRQQIAARKVKWTDDSFLTTFGITAAIFLITTMTGSMFYSCRRYPDLPPPAAAAKVEPCVESVQIVRVNETPKACSPGATLESKPAGSRDNGDLVINCVCKK